MVRFPQSKKHPALVLLLLMFLVFPAFAQEETTEVPETDTDSETPREEQAVEEEPSENSDELEEELTKQSEIISQQQETIKKLQSELEGLTKRIDDVEQAQEDTELAELVEEAAMDFEPSLDIYGFLSVEAVKFLAKKDSPIYGLIVNKTSIATPDLNIYFKGQMSETMSALVELRFAFLPQGAETSYFPTYSRIDTTVNDPRRGEDLTFGGLIIERAQFTWLPRDFFGITAGRYLTPFGIWNEEHAPLVVIPMAMPYILLRKNIPLAQTGLMAHGTFYPAPRLYLSYAVTFSNGRGPTEAVYDMDENKAVGTRLKLSYEGDNSKVSLGGYGYYGQYTDLEKVIDFDTITFEEQLTDQHTELSGSIDLLLEFYGVRIQGEYLRRKTTYTERPLREVPLAQITVEGNYQPDFISWDVYGLLAWTLPLEKLLEDMKLTPYVMYEYSVADDTLSDTDITLLRGGLTFMPKSFLVLKVGYSYMKFIDSEIIPSPVHTVTSQAAIAF